MAASRASMTPSGLKFRRGRDALHKAQDFVIPELTSRWGFRAYYLKSGWGTGRFRMVAEHRSAQTFLVATPSRLWRKPSSKSQLIGCLLYPLGGLGVHRPRSQ